MRPQTPAPQPYFVPVSLSRNTHNRRHVRRYFNNVRAAVHQQKKGCHRPPAEIRSMMVRPGLTQFCWRRQMRSTPALFEGVGMSFSQPAKEPGRFSGPSRSLLETYLVSLLGEAVNSFGFAIGRAVRLTSIGAPAAAP